MTKKEMIKRIQVAEAIAWKTLGEMKDAFGTDSAEATAARRAWGAVFDLREQLGLPGLPVLELIQLNLLPTRKTQAA
jgi:hypothetical protein